MVPKETKTFKRNKKRMTIRVKTTEWVTNKQKPLPRDAPGSIK